MWQIESVAAVRTFLETGGNVLLVISCVTLAMWALILERMWFYVRVYPGEARRAQQAWEQRGDRSSWYANQIRRRIASKVQVKLDQGLVMIRTLIALCPLLGLLGTVTGMIEVFDVLAVSGSGNARAMASGVSKATIPTMAGMVAALSGLMISIQMDRYARREGERMVDRLTQEGAA